MAKKALPNRNPTEPLKKKCETAHKISTLFCLIFLTITPAPLSQAADPDPSPPPPNTDTAQSSRTENPPQQNTTEIAATGNLHLHIAAACCIVISGFMICSLGLAQFSRARKLTIINTDQSPDKSEKQDQTHGSNE